jgi:heat shock protein HslJ/membrane-bound inhibitor of C-type lysozyme
MKRFLLTAGIISAFAVTACKEEQKNSATPETPAAVTESVPATDPAITFPKTVYYQCGEESVVFTLLSGDKANMKIANVSYAMERAISASGAKFQNLGDPETYLWSKGNMAQLRINGTDSPACVETAKPKAPPAPYRASGNEPGWSVVIEGDTLDLVADYGDSKARLPVVRDVTAGAVRTITASDGHDTVVMTVEDKRCDDDMSGEAFAHTVSLTRGGKAYKGCGKSLIRHVTWILQGINNDGVIGDSRITLTFGTEARLYGRSGCNNYNGGYSLEGENLQVDENMASTMMACIADGVMQQEQKYLKILSGVNKAAVDETGALILSGDKGDRLLFREDKE